MAKRGKHRLSSRTAERRLRAIIRARLKRLRELVEKHATEAFIREGVDRADSPALRTDAKGYDPARLRRMWVRIAGDPVPEAESVAQTVHNSVDRSLAGAMRALVPETRPLPEQLDIDKLAANTAGYIRNLEDEYVERVGKKLGKIATGEASQSDLRKMLRDEAGIADRRAQLIARDQVGTMQAEIASERAKEVGADRYIWRTQRDERVRPEHADREGKSFSWSEPPPDGHPGEPINCLPGDSNLVDAFCAEVLYRRRYTGELTELVTDTGKTLRATPNHPILTPRGWLPIQFLNEGDQVIECCDRSVELAPLEVENGQSTFDETFDTFAALLGAVDARGSSFQFHGDGTDEEVDIVHLDGGLPGVFDVTLSEEFCELFFAVADQATSDVLLPGDRSPDKFVAALFRAPHRIVRVAGKLLAFFCRQSIHTKKHRLRAASRLDALFEKSPANHRSSYSELLGDGLLAGAVEVERYDFIAVQILSVVRGMALARIRTDASLSKFDAESVRTNPEALADRLQRLSFVEQFGRVVEKRSGVFTTHVHNVQSALGCYIADGTIYHNCRCYAEPDLDAMLDSL